MIIMNIKKHTRFKKMIGMVLLVTLLLMTFSGCKDSQEPEEMIVDSTTGSAISEIEEAEVEEEVVEVEPEVIIEPTYGGTLNIAIQEPISMSPVTNTDKNTDEWLRLVYEPLFKLNDEMLPEPWLVDTYNYDMTNNSLSISLKEGILFHDGQPLTTADVEYTINALEDGYSIYANQVNMVQYMTIVDEMNMIIYFKENYAFYLYDMTIPIVSATYENAEDYDQLTTNGTGPYMMSEFTSMQSMTLDYFEDFHEEMPYISTIQCLICRDEEAESNAFDQGLVDVFVPTQLDWRTYSEIEIKPIEYTTEYVNFIGFNHDNILFDDLDFKKAIAHAIDRESMLEAWYLDHGIVSDSLIHPDSYLNTGEVVYDFDPNQSADILLQLGLLDGDGNGIIDDPVSGDDLQLHLLVNSENELRVGMSGMAKSYIEALGIEVIVDALPRAAFNEAMNNGDYDLVLTGWKMPAKPDFIGLFHSDYIELGYNFINYSNELMNVALENVYLSTYDMLQAQIEEFNNLYAEELPYLTIGFVNSAVLTQEDVYGEMKPTTDDVYGGLSGIYVID